jgi:hypothetical protein
MYFCLKTIFLHHIPLPLTPPQALAQKAAFWRFETVRHTFVDLRKRMIFTSHTHPRKQISAPTPPPPPSPNFIVGRLRRNFGKRLIPVSPIERSSSGLPIRPTYGINTILLPGAVLFSLRWVHVWRSTSTTVKKDYHKFREICDNKQSPLVLL